MTLSQLKKIFATSKKTEAAYPILEKYMDQFGINTILRQAHFLSQIGHESLQLNVLSENLNYSAAGLLKTFPKYFPNQKVADQYARDPVAIASKVYASRMSNGDEASQDGWAFRGRGAIQLTGKANYQAFKKDTGIDVIENPNYLSTLEGAIHSACWFWRKNNLNALADKDDVVAVTKKINGGTIGLEDRKKYLSLAKKALA